ncbi:pyridoxamine 5'-phosphate oxidase [Paenimyroides ummariense]|uniref:Pyridoxine/pyridoxamine 5'-phosphate oxidase n=1 Tax=Paenimyroides ummariense TaxID=913024 RepID=A0A1I5FHA4_9FLAO|nr:pyridoxamine 5'-phosphate oxidase [Paenimyroides ummariense]SFO23013.1 pyridoxamine 5'-phosphate oxidase [Paenimyroides ummariense]
MSDLSNYRKSYEKSELLESMIDENPMMQFQKWFYETEEFGGVEEVNAMTVSTIGLDGFPKSRIVLLKKYDEYGFTFVTNYDSEKGKALLQNPQVCLSFFWPSVERQVIIKGIAEKQTEAYSKGYFHSRPKGSQIGTVVSPQSTVIPNREFLDEKLKSLETEYQNTEVPKPENWGGILVKPISIEFWQGRANRLHDRIRYTLLESGDWKIERLAP